MIHAIDVSSHQPRDLSAIFAALPVRPQHVVVRFYLPEEQPPEEHTLEQVASTKALGASVGGYCWGYPDLSPGKTVDDTLALAGRAGVTLPILWLDLEEYQQAPGPDTAWISRFEAACNGYGQRWGIYSARWYWLKHMAIPGTNPPQYRRDFEHVPWWIAEYDNIDDLSNFDTFEGLGQVAGKQYTNAPVDQSVMLEAVTDVAQAAAPSNLRGLYDELWRDLNRLQALGNPEVSDIVERKIKQQFVVGSKQLIGGW